MSYDNVSFAMATPILGRVANFMLNAALGLAKQNREFAALRRITALHLAGFSNIVELRDRNGELWRLPRRFLIFYSLFDGSAAAYLKDFEVVVPDEIDSIWGKCVRYPGARSGEKFAHWLETHALATPANKQGEATTYEFSGCLIDTEELTPRMPVPERRMAPFPLVMSAVGLRDQLVALRARGALSEEQTMIALRELGAELP